jgi:hypothetical protein
VAALDLKDLKLFESALEDVGDAFKDIGDEAKDASKEVEDFEKRIYALIIKSNPMPRLVKDINDQLSRQADQMRQTMKAADELSRAYERLAKAQGGLKTGTLKPGPKFGSAAKSAIDKSPMEAPEPTEPPMPQIPRERSKKSVAGGLTSPEAEALGGSAIEAIASLSKGDEPLKVLIDLGEEVAKTFLKASIEGVSLATELKRMGVSTGVLKVVGADAKAAQAGLALMTGAAGELRAATVGMGEAATVAGAAEMVAFTPVGVVLGGIALAVGAVATVFAVTAQQIGKSTGENLDHLKLTEEQLARVKDKGVTMGDVLSGVWKTTTDVLQDAFGPALKWLGDLFGKVYQGVVDGVLWVVKSNVQAIGGFIGGFKAAFGNLGFAIGDLVISGLNMAGQAVQQLVNKAFDAINNLIRMGNAAAEKVGLSIRLPELKPISIGQIDNPFEGKAAAFGKDLYKGVVDGAEGAGKALDALGDRMVKNIVNARNTRVLKEAGDDVKKAADAACNCGSNSQTVANDNRSYRSGGAGAASEEPIVASYKMPVSVQEQLARPDTATEPLIDTGLEEAAKAIEAVLGPLDAMVDKMTNINALAPELGKQFEAAFGKTGKAMGGLLTSFSAYSLEVAKIQREAAGRDLSPEQREQRTKAQIKAYGAMASAAKGFFEENSAGYKALEVAEIAFNTLQTLNTIKSMALETTSAAHTVGTQGTKQAAYGVTAYAHALADLPFPFNLLAGAAVLAALVQVGVAIKGKPGGGAAPGANDMKTRQEAQGSGSVLGDPKAKSESLEKALTHAQAYENKDLEYGNAMVRSLRSIDGQIGAVAAALARSFGAGGMLSTEGLNLGKTGSSASLSNFGFSKSTTRTLQDQGIQFDAATLGDITDGKLSGSTYQQVLETTKKKAVFVTTSSKSKVITETGALDTDFVDQVTKLITSLGKGVTDAADAIKATGVQKILASFKVDLGKLSFKDMTGTQIEEALNAIFGKLGDDMAKAAVPAIAEFQKVGEGAFETLVRVARQYEVIDTTLKSVGMKFNEVGVASLAARERLVDLVGGLDNLTEQTAFFGENFLSEGERLKPVRESVSGKLVELGQPADLSREGFKALVLAQDVSTEAGARLYAALMDLAPAFDKVATAAEASEQTNIGLMRQLTAMDDAVLGTTVARDAARADELKGLDDTGKALQKIIWKRQDEAKILEKRTSIQDQIDDLTLSPAAKLAKSRDVERKAVEDLDKSLVPLLKNLWDLQDAAEAAKLATDRSNMYADLLEAQGRTAEATQRRRALALAAIEDPVQQQYQTQIWAAQDAAEKVSAARDVLTQAYESQKTIFEGTVDRFKALSESLKAFSASLSDTIAGTDLATRYRTTRDTFQTTAAQARLGDEDAMGRLQAQGEAFTSAARDHATSTIDYLRDVALVRGAVDDAADTADRQVSIAEEQLKALERSVSGLIRVEAGVGSVKDAIVALQAALTEAKTAGVASVGGQTTTVAAAGGAAPVNNFDSTLSSLTWEGKRIAYNDPHYQEALIASLNAQAAKSAEQVAAEQSAALAEGQKWAESIWGVGFDPTNVFSGMNGNGWKGFATGGVFANGVVTRPTAFDMGQMGEAGPEAIMPLTRTASGALGVRASGGSSGGDESLINELRRLREEMADLRQTSARIANSNDKMERTLTNVTEGGRAMQTSQAAA